MAKKDPKTDPADTLPETTAPEFPASPERPSLVQEFMSDLNDPESITARAAALAPAIPVSQPNPAASPALPVIEQPPRNVKVRLVQPGIIRVGDFEAGRDYTVDASTADGLLPKGFIIVE